MVSILPKRASECARFAGTETDPVRKKAFLLLRDMWTALDRTSCTMRPHDLTTEIAAIEQIQRHFQHSNAES
jgi:hypothetical protein